MVKSGIISVTIPSHLLEDANDSLRAVWFVDVMGELMQFVGEDGMELKEQPEFICGDSSISVSLKIKALQSPFLVPVKILLPCGNCSWSVV